VDRPVQPPPQTRCRHHSPRWDWDLLRQSIPAQPTGRSDRTLPQFESPMGTTAEYNQRSEAGQRREIRLNREPCSICASPRSPPSDISWNHPQRDWCRTPGKSFVPSVGGGRLSPAAGVAARRAREPFRLGAVITAGAAGCLPAHMEDGCLRLLRLRPDLVHKSPLHQETACRPRWERVPRDPPPAWDRGLESSIGSEPSGIKGANRLDPGPVRPVPLAATALPPPVDDQTPRGPVARHTGRSDAVASLPVPCDPTP